MLDDFRPGPLTFFHRAGTPIGPYEVLIAGQARARNLILVTNNSRKLSHVDGLQIEDWHIIP